MHNDRRLQHLFIRLYHRQTHRKQLQVAAFVKQVFGKLAKCLHFWRAKCIRHTTALRMQNRRLSTRLHSQQLMRKSFKKLYNWSALQTKLASFYNSSRRYGHTKNMLYQFISHRIASFEQLNRSMEKHSYDH